MVSLRKFSPARFRQMVRYHIIALLAAKLRGYSLEFAIFDPSCLVAEFARFNLS